MSNVINLFTGKPLTATEQLKHQTQTIEPMPYDDLPASMKDQIEALIGWIQSEQAKVELFFDTPEFARDYFEEDYRDNLEKIMGKSLTREEYRELMVQTEIKAYPDYGCHDEKGTIDSICLYHEEHDVPIGIGNIPSDVFDLDQWNDAELLTLIANIKERFAIDLELSHFRHDIGKAWLSVQIGYSYYLNLPEHLIPEPVYVYELIKYYKQDAIPTRKYCTITQHLLEQVDEIKADPLIIKSLKSQGVLAKHLHTSKIRLNMHGDDIKITYYGKPLCGLQCTKAPY